MEKAILSKSTFIKGEQCLKALYLYKNNYSLRDKMPADRVAVFNRGSRVGELAQTLFPNGINCKIGGPRQYSKAIEKTKECIQFKEKALYEAAFLANNTLIYLDILTYENEKWHAYEVKSSAKISDTYLLDAALQYYIIKKSGLKIADFHLIFIDEEYIRGEEIAVNQLFKMQDVTDQIKLMQENISQKISLQLSTLEDKKAPEISIGPHCKKPYDCDFQGFCWKGVDKSIFEIPALDFENQCQLFELKESNQLKIKFPNEIAKKQYHYQTLKKDYFDASFVQRIINQESSIIILNLLTYRPAIPWYKETKPYQTIAYAYLWSEVTLNGKIVENRFYISNNQYNPSNDIVKKLESELRDKQIFSFFEDEYLHEFYQGLNIIDFKRELIDGHIIGHNLKDYSFDGFIQAFSGKSPWYKGIMADKQAGLKYEKEFIENRNIESIQDMISDYLQDKNKYFVKTVINILKTNSND